MNIEENDTEFYKGHSIAKHKPKTNKVVLKTTASNIKKVLESHNYSFKDVFDIAVSRTYYGNESRISINISDERAIELAKKNIDDKIKREAKKILKLKEKLELAQKELEQTLENTAEYERFLNITPEE